MVVGHSVRVGPDWFGGKFSDSLNLGGGLGPWWWLFGFFFFFFFFTTISKIMQKKFTIPQ
jgi:hypothetical protein